MTGFQKGNLGKRSSLYDYSWHAENIEIIKEKRSKRKELCMLLRKKYGEIERIRMRERKGESEREREREKGTK